MRQRQFKERLSERPAAMAVFFCFTARKNVHGCQVGFGSAAAAT